MAVDQTQNPRSSTTLSCQAGSDSSKPTTPTQTPPMPSSVRTSQDGHPDSPDTTKEKAVPWSDPSNTYNPFNWPDAKKWRVTLLASFMTFVIQINGTMMTSAAEQINKSFNVSDETFPYSYWPVLSWNLGGAAAPLLGLPLMENLGVRKTYMVNRGCGQFDPNNMLIILGHLRYIDHLHCSSSRVTKLRNYYRDPNHHWRMFGCACKYYVWHRKRHLESWTSEKFRYFPVHLCTACGIEYGSCLR
jgi:hypothetical protein